MPDHGERPSEEIERTLERTLEVAAYGDLPTSDYGSTLLSPAHHVSGGRKVTGGIMFLANYKGPTVNIRAPKWTDNVFWIKAENYEAAQYIADVVYYYTGRGPFHFRVAQFHYPPLCLSNRNLLTTRETCLAYVRKIAKGPELRRERGDYRERVKKLVLKEVTSPEAVKFLRSLRAIPPAVPNFGSTLALEGDETANSEETLSVASEEQGTPMEADTVSEEAIRSLVPAERVDPGLVFHLPPSETSLFRDVDISTAFVASFGMDLDESGNILQSENQSLGVGYRRLAKEVTIPSNFRGLFDEEFFGEAPLLDDGISWQDLPDLDESGNILQSENQSLGVGYRRLAKEVTIPSNFKGLLDILDKEEEEIFRSTEWFDPEAIHF